MKKDKITLVMSRAINILFLYNALGTSYGVLLGVVILAFQDFIASYFPPFGLIDWYGFIALGVLLFNIKPMVTKKYLDPDIEKQLVYIRQMLKEGKLTRLEERAIWRNAINSIITEYNYTKNNDEHLNNPTPQ